MGLDTFAARSPARDLSAEDEAAFEEAKPQLTGGMYSGSWDSFRGKVYEELVRHITGVSLYELWIPPATVRRMWEAFERCDPERVAEETEAFAYEASAHEIIELRRFFRICAERELGLVGWW